MPPGPWSQYTQQSTDDARDVATDGVIDRLLRCSAGYDCSSTAVQNKLKADSLARSLTQELIYCVCVCTYALVDRR